MAILIGIYHPQKQIKFTELPIEIIVHILKNVTPDDIKNISTCSSLLYNIATTFEWDQIFIPCNTQNIMRQIKFMNISFINCYTQIIDILCLTSIKTIFINEIAQSIQCDSDICCAYFSHLLNIGCENIIFKNSNSIVKMQKYLPPEINYYYVYSTLINGTLINAMGSIRCEIYSKKIHLHLFENLSDYDMALGIKHTFATMTYPNVYESGYGKLSDFNMAFSRKYVTVEMTHSYDGRLYSNSYLYVDLPKKTIDTTVNIINTDLYKTLTNANLHETSVNTNLHEPQTNTTNDEFTNKKKRTRGKLSRDKKLIQHRLNKHDQSLKKQQIKIRATKYNTYSHLKIFNNLK